MLRTDATGFERVERTGADGFFAFRNLSSGSYHLLASLSGFAPATAELAGPSEEPVHLVLRPAPYQEAVTVVSAARQERLRDTASIPVTVVGGAAMRDAGHETVGAALRDVAGIVTRRGSEGTGVAGEQIQGIDSRQVLVLVDGQPVVGARGVKSGILDLDRESTQWLDRIEIVKGAASALYGSDAIGGVINLISREPRRPAEFAGSVSGGSHGIVDAAADAGGIGRWGTFFVSGGRHQRDAFDLTPSTPDTTGAALQRNALTARASTSPSAIWLLTGTATSYWHTLTGRSVGELGPQENRTPSDAQTFGARAEWRVDSQTTAEFRAYRGRYQETSTGALLNASRTPVEPGDLFQGLSKLDGSIARTISGRQQLRGGVEWMRDAYRGLNRIRDLDGDTATTRVVWGQYEVNPINRVTVTTGVRVDDHSAFGTAVSPKAGANVRLSDVMSARVSFGRGFRAPDLGQLYYRFLNPTNLYQVIGNRLLQPERSSSWQVGFDAHTSARAHLGVNLCPVLSAVPMRMVSALDDHPVVAEILASRARTISRDAGHEVVILVAHGPVSDEENALWLADMRRLAERIASAISFVRVDVLTVRDDAPGPVRAAATSELRALVTRASSEGHRALIVPLLLSFGGIEDGIRKRLDGLDYVMAPEALMPDERLVRWVFESANLSARGQKPDVPEARSR